MSLRFLLCFLCLSSALLGADLRKPNILFLFADDLSYETIRAFGHTDIDTPNLDRLVSRGTTFTHAYNMGSWSGAVCVASRTMALEIAGAVKPAHVEFRSLLPVLTGAQQSRPYGNVRRSSGPAARSDPRRVEAHPLPGHACNAPVRCRAGSARDDRRRSRLAICADQETVVPAFARPSTRVRGQARPEGCLS